MATRDCVDFNVFETVPCSCNLDNVPIETVASDFMCSSNGSILTLSGFYQEQNSETDFISNNHGNYNGKVQCNINESNPDSLNIISHELNMSDKESPAMCNNVSCEDDQSSNILYPVENDQPTQCQFAASYDSMSHDSMFFKDDSHRVKETFTMGGDSLVGGNVSLSVIEERLIPNEHDDNQIAFDPLVEILNRHRLKNPHFILIGHVNVNSIRYKFDYFQDILSKNLLVLCFN